MKKSWIFIILLLSLPLANGLSQTWRTTPYEVILGVGSSNIFGDIGGTTDENNWFGLKDIRIYNTRPSIHGGFRYFLPENFSVRGNLSISLLGDTDKNSRNENRGFSFTTLIFEPSALGEYFILRDFSLNGRIFNRRGLLRNYATISVYVFTGLGGVIYFVNPNDNLKTVQDLRDIDHSFITLALPLGVGMKVGIANYFDIGLEIGGRYTFSDHLDGYTSRFSKAKDIYYLTHLNVIYRIPFR